MASGGMLLALYGWKPYTDDGDDRDAFISQMVGPFISFPNHFHFHYHSHENANRLSHWRCMSAYCRYLLPMSNRRIGHLVSPWTFHRVLILSFSFPLKLRHHALPFLITLLRMAPHFFHDSSAVSSVRNDLAGWVSTYPGHFLRRGRRAITWAAKVLVQECHGSSWLCSERHRGMCWHWERPS